MKFKLILALIIAAVFITAVQGFSHTPLCSCYDGGDGTIICEGGFSDGSSASGVKIKVVDEDGNVITHGKMDEFSEFIFDKPSKDYKVVFDAGPGHNIKIKSKNITE